MKKKNMYAVARNLCGEIDYIRLFPTENEAENGMRVAIKEFFSTLGVNNDLPEDSWCDNLYDHAEEYTKALRSAHENEALPNICSMYGLRYFTLDDARRDYVSFGYCTEDDFGGTVYGDTPYLSWTVCRNVQ